MIIQANPEHEVAFQDLCSLVNKHADKVSAMELLAIASNMLGKLVAMQDQHTVTQEIAMQIVTLNIEVGNRQAVDKLDRSVSGVPS